MDVNINKETIDLEDHWSFFFTPVRLIVRMVKNLWIVVDGMLAREREYAKEIVTLLETAAVRDARIEELEQRINDLETQPPTENQMTEPVNFTKAVDIMDRIYDSFNAPEDN